MYCLRTHFVAMAALTMMVAGPVRADTAVMDDATSGFQQETGEELYNNICLGCHMADAKGAKGAGQYPALAENPRLAAAAYPVYVVTYGQKAMPAFGGLLSDKQIATVVNYVRTHFGNDYDADASADDVSKIRRPDYEYVTLE